MKVEQRKYRTCKYAATKLNEIQNAEKYKQKKRRKKNKKFKIICVRMISKSNPHPSFVYTYRCHSDRILTETLSTTECATNA